MKSKLSDFDKKMIEKSIDLAISNAEKGGHPFGAVLTRNQEIINEGVNETYLNQDLTAHAEMQALRESGKELNGDPELTMYASGKPCAMCMAAMIQVKIPRVVFAADDELGGEYGWPTEHLYESMKKDFGEQGVEIVNFPHPKSKEAFEAYDKKNEVIRPIKEQK